MRRHIYQIQTGSRRYHNSEIFFKNKKGVWRTVQIAAGIALCRILSFMSGEKKQEKAYRGGFPMFPKV